MDKIKFIMNIKNFVNQFQYFLVLQVICFKKIVNLNNFILKISKDFYKILIKFLISNFKMNKIMIQNYSTLI